MPSVVFTPSIWMRTWPEKPKASKPVWVPARDPPTSRRETRTPGACPITDQMSRAFGSDCSMSCVTLNVLVVLDTSTTGDAPETVTVSCSDATCSWTLTVAVNPRFTTMPSRTTLENPESSYVSW